MSIFRLNALKSAYSTLANLAKPYGFSKKKKNYCFIFCLFIYFLRIAEAASHNDVIFLGGQLFVNILLFTQK